MARGQDYIRAKAREALDAAGGNRHEASLLLRVWAEADDKLYRALTGPVLNNLAALAVQRAAGASDGRKIGRPAGGRSPETDLLAAIGSKTAPTMSSSRQTVSRPGMGSARHKQAVTVLASAYRRRPKGK
ncbi:MAG: hypothetical protein HQ481_15860 [Alphaproteobacteria bacterium]|nr:hypothetical protein [Alphaproteobacteria bacterium]